MAYNGFPATYAPMYYQPQYQQPQQPQQNGIIWVSGEAGAKAYLVAPNTTVQLWDSETQRIFLKSADASGMPSMKVLEYTIREKPAVSPTISEPTEQPTNPPAYATRAEFAELAQQFEAMRAEIDGLTKKGATLNE